MKNYEYDISIIVPVYNTEKYLKRCIDSLLNQSFSFDKMQLILINDGSKDSSLDICNEYKNKYNNIVVIDKANGGVSSARNAGLKEAKGKYILFVDSDDYISENTCLKLYEFFEKNFYEIDILTYPIMNVKTDKTYMHYRYKTFYKKGTGIYDLNKDPHIIQATINVMIKNGLKISFDKNQNYSEDEKFVTTIIMQHKKIGFVKQARYFYNKCNDNISANKSVVKETKTLNMIYKYYYNLLKEYNSDAYIEQLFINTLRWRIEEKKLYPNDTTSHKEIDALLKETLSLVNNESVKNYIGLNSLDKAYIMKLKGEKISAKITNNSCNLIVGDKEFIKEKHIKIDLYRFNVIDNKLVLSGRLNTPIFEFMKPKLFMVIKTIDKEENIEIDLEESVYNNYDGCRQNILYKFDKSIDMENIKECNFYVEINSTKFDTSISCVNNISNIIRTETIVIAKKERIVFTHNKFISFCYFLRKTIGRRKNPTEMIKRFKYYFIKKNNTIVCYDKDNNINYKDIITNNIDIDNVNLQKQINLFMKSSYIITDEVNIVKISPLKNKTKIYNDLYNVLVIWKYNGNTDYQSMKEYTNVNYVIVRNDKEKNDVIKLLKYSDSEIIIN